MDKFDEESWFNGYKFAAKNITERRYNPAHWFHAAVNISVSTPFTRGLQDGYLTAMGY